ncbi:helix-turn-helix transcriptional regulator [Streptomyces sp. MCA2]|uniref:helix-turn-helix domain-containing protein n=1 Tax=Streptomyces sp. MCA2 TaxID=2944805 RepID=UPI0020208477|nr:helix-turn-helix transcriptional regulator [Streptomyces sp. MCA2]MCL7493862.1 helix-turn-helix transcriptional regulator [Streptomyces sp. MCA2]
MRSNVRSIEEYLGEADRSPTALGLMLAQSLKELREEAGLTPAQAAKIIGVHASQMSRLENGQRRWQETGLVSALRAYGVGPEGDHLTLRLLRASAESEWKTSFRSDVLPGWFKLFAGLEPAAKELRSFENRAVPGQLQCEPYAQAIIEGDAMGATNLARRRLKLRKERQERVLRKNGPAQWVVLEEGVLDRQFAEPHVIRAQLLHLKKLLEDHPQITVQILPTRLGVSRPSGSFTYLRFDLEGISDKVYVEDPTGAKYYDDEEELQEYQMTFDRLAASALDAEQTPRILDEVLKGLQ